MISPLTIIATVNYSAVSNNAVTYAARLAETSGARLILFHSFSLSVHSSNSLITSEAVQKQIEKTFSRLQVLGNEIADLFKIQVSCFCSYSFLEEELSRLIKKENADLVVMGMPERSFEQELIGNPTASVIKNIDIPVLAVPQKARFHKLKKLLYACDDLSLSSIQKSSKVRRIIGDVGVEFEFFSVEDKLSNLKQEQALSLLNSTVEKEFSQVKYLYKSVKSNNVIEEIKKEIKNYGADILVMVPQKYGFWDSLIHKSKTRVMAAGLDIPLLSLPTLFRL